MVFFVSSHFKSNTGSIINLDVTDECLPRTIVAKSLKVIILFGGNGKYITTPNVSFPRLPALPAI